MARKSRVHWVALKVVTDVPVSEAQAVSLINWQTGGVVDEEHYPDWRTGVVSLKTKRASTLNKALKLRDNQQAKLKQRL